MKNIWMNCVFKCFFIGIVFIKYCITQTKIFKVKVANERLWLFQMDNNFGTKVVLNKFLSLFRSYQLGLKHWRNHLNHERFQSISSDTRNGNHHRLGWGEQLALPLAFPFVFTRQTTPPHSPSSSLVSPSSTSLRARQKGSNG